MVWLDGKLSEGFFLNFCHRYFMKPISRLISGYPKTQFRVPESITSPSSPKKESTAFEFEGLQRLLHPPSIVIKKYPLFDWNMNHPNKYTVLRCKNRKKCNFLEVQLFTQNVLKNQLLLEFLSNGAAAPKEPPAKWRIILLIKNYVKF